MMMLLISYNKQYMCEEAVRYDYVGHIQNIFIRKVTLKLRLLNKTEIGVFTGKL
jgi:hypothetical protein